MRKLLLLLLLSLCVVVAAAQKNDQNLDLVGIPIIVKKKSADPTFRAIIAGKPVMIERIDAPETVPLRIAVIDLRDVDATGRIKEELPSVLRSLNLHKLRAQAELIRIGQSPTKENQFPGGWSLYASPDFETALRQAKSFFAAGRQNERQSLLIIKNSSQAERFDDGQLNAAMSFAAGRLLTVLPVAPPNSSGEYNKTTLNAQIRKWRDSLSLFFVIRVAAGTVPIAGGRVNVEAVSKNKVVGRGSTQINSSLPASDEVETAFADFQRLVNFEKLEKYPGLPEAELEFFKSHYAPPVEGVVIDSDPVGNERLKKLSDRVFLLHGVQEQCAVVLLDSRLPTVFTWKMTFVSLTAKDLETLNDEEITALIAHEIGHLYFAAD